MPDELLIPIDNVTAPMRPDFKHLTGAHCESSAITALLRREGLPITEALTFGLTSTLTYCYFSFVRINGLPLLSYRMFPRHIVKNMKRLLRLPMRFERFGADSRAGTARLNELLDEGRIVGLQGSIMHLTYFPLSWRFPFNAHNFMAYGRDPENGDYYVSDPVFAHQTRCKPADMARARFVRGALTPHGFLYYLDGKIPSTDIASIVPLLRGAIRKNAFMMIYAPVPFVGIMGMRLFAARMRRLPTDGPKVDYTRDFIGHIARMQEEIGTGGAGFRYLYATFLKEASVLLNKPVLAELSHELSDAISPDWRNLAMLAVRQNKGRDPLDPRGLSALLDGIAAKECAFFKKVRKLV